MKSTNEILEGLLRQVQPVNFYEIAKPKDLKEGENFKLTNNKIIVISIDQVLKLCKQNQWGLCINNGAAYLYNGCYWTEVDPNLLKNFLGEAAARQGVDRLASKHFNYRENLLKQFFSAAFLQEPEPDPDKVMINLQNGTLEISAKDKSYKLREFRPEDFLKYQLPFEYDPKATAPKFAAFLNHVLPDPSSRMLLLEYCGYIFVKHGSGKLKLEKVLLLYGTGANGKSGVFEILQKLLGSENVSNYSLANLTDTTGYYRAEIGDKLLNYASEISGSIGQDHFKAMASGEPITARRPYRDAANLRQYAKLIFNCNELPKDTEQTHGFFRRFMIIPFEVTIPTEEQDPELYTKITDSELSGILNLILEGLQRLLQHGKFTVCQSAENSVKKYELESNSVASFLSERLYQPSTKTSRPLQQLFTDYKEHCTYSLYKPCSLRTFSDRLKKLGYTSERKNYGMEIYIENTKDYLPPSLAAYPTLNSVASGENVGTSQTFQF
jgi:putative DNA primase/helicase